MRRNDELAANERAQTEDLLHELGSDATPTPSGVDPHPVQVSLRVLTRPRTDGHAHQGSPTSAA